MKRRSSAKILVTGGAGFIGSEFVRQAIAAGKRIVVVDKLTYAGDRKRLQSVKDKISFYKADITQTARMTTILKKERVQTIVHFAAETHVDRSILDPQPFIKTNVEGTLSLIKAARAQRIKKFIHISTDEVYGEIQRGKFREDSPLHPNNPYSATKAAADMLVMAAIRTYRFPAIIVRPCNNYGPWQYPEKFIPVIILKAMRRQRVPVYGRGHNVREWLYVTDCSRAIAQILKRGKVGEIYNVGSRAEKRNIDLVKTLLRHLKQPRRLIQFVKDRPGHDIRYSLDSRKIRALGWRPDHSFAGGLQLTLHWAGEHFPWLRGKSRYLKQHWRKVYKKRH